VLTDGDLLDTIDYLSPLGKSDHSVLSITCDINISNKCLLNNLTIPKEITMIYDLCNFMDTDWAQSLSQCSDTEEMWLLFEDRLPLPHQQCYNSFE